MTPPTSILVLGAGELGTAILDALTSHPAYRSSSVPKPSLAVLRRAATLASRDAATQSELAGLAERGIALEAGDLAGDGVGDLAQVFAKYDVVIQAGGYGMPRGTLRRVAEVAVAAGVGRFFPWQFGIDYAAVAAAGVEGSAHAELFGEMLDVREVLRSQRRTRWTVVSTGLFMSFLFLSGFGVVDFGARTLRALGGWANKVTVTDVGDIGRMVAEAVYHPSKTEDKVVYVGGDTVSYAEVADIVEGVYGGAFERVEWDMECLRKRLAEQPTDLMLKYQNVFGEGVGVSWGLERTLNYQRGIKLISLREYVERNKDRLAESAN